MIAALLLAAATVSAAAPARYANVQLSNPAQEAQARNLMGSIRCLVCQGQSIADSDADMAGDMRALIRERIAAGEEPAEVRNWLIARYGDYVSYDPPFSATTAPLWIAPLLLLCFGFWIARASLKRRRG